MIRSIRASFFVGCLAVVAVCSNSLAQIGGTTPRSQYYLGKQAYYEGNYVTAERGFIRSLKSGVRIGQVRWIDSVCYYTMLGEVYLHQGLLARSLEMHELAIQVHLTNPGWMGRLTYPRIVPSNDRIQARILWGQRPTPMGAFPDSMNSLEGTLDLSNTFQFGGAVNPAHTRSVDAVEVFRCLAVSLRRRSQLLGPTAPLSKQTGRIMASLEAVTAPPGHWVASWVEVLYGLALFSDAQSNEGIAHLNAGLTVAGFDHPLTGIALLEIGRKRLRSKDYKAALALLQQASIAGARFRQADVVEESFRHMNDAFLANEQKGTYANIGSAVLYAQQLDFFRLVASLNMESAELAVYNNQGAAAVSSLTLARTIIQRQRLNATEIGGRISYLDALTQYQLGNGAAAKASMASALGYMTRGSFKRFHLTLVEGLASKGRKAITPRNAELLYEYMLREPTDNDWRIQPMESFTMLLSKHNGSIERWFELLIDRREFDKAVRVAELLRRHRFYATLPFGGRALSLRWLVEGDINMLGRTGIAEQNRLRDEYPQLAKLSTQSEKIRANLKNDTLLPQDEEQLKQQREDYKRWATVTEGLENIINGIALRREPAKLVFPPQPSLNAIKKGMQQNQAILMFVTTSQGWHAWFIRKDSDDYWRIRNPKGAKRALASLLKEIGNRDGNGKLSPKHFASEAWKKPAKALWKQLIGKFPSNGWDGLEELVIVPDGELWYLPFEVLQIPADQIEGSEEDAMLINRTRVRYAPIASLSVADQIGHKSDHKTTLVGGELFPRESSEHAGEMLKRLKADLVEMEVVTSKRKPIQSSRYTAGLMDRLIVWNDIRFSRNAPYDWSPAQYDRDKSNGQLSDWIVYPWGGPDQVILPGFHTAAEGTLKNAKGYEVFLAACGMMATGTRTALLSRWRTGGRAPAVLVREFATALPTLSASEAWRTAVELTRAEKLDPVTEPRLAKSKDVQELSADHPFFWSGYLLIDTGAEPKETDEDVLPPADPAKEDDDDPEQDNELPADPIEPVLEDAIEVDAPKLDVETDDSGDDQSEEAASDEQPKP